MIKEFIVLSCNDGTILPGCISRAKENNKSIAIFVHGNNANFFKLKYFDYLHKEFYGNGIDLLIFNNRGAEAHLVLKHKVNGEYKHFNAGTMYENFDDCLIDIDAAVKYAIERGYNDIILIGESLGTTKVTYYAIKNKNIKKLVLLSPVDMVNRFRSRVKDKYDQLVIKSKKLVLNNLGDTMVTDEFSALKVYSACSPESNQCVFPMEEGRINDYIFSYDGAVSVIIGTIDHVNKEWGAERPVEVLNQKFKNASIHFSFIKGADHVFKNCESELAKCVIKTILNM